MTAVSLTVVASAVLLVVCANGTHIDLSVLVRLPVYPSACLPVYILTVTQPRACVYIIHGYGEHIGRYEGESMRDDREGGNVGTHACML